MIKLKRETLIILIILMLSTSSNSFASNSFNDAVKKMGNSHTTTIVLRRDANISKEFAKASLRSSTSLLDGVMAETQSTKMIIRKNSGISSLMLEISEPKLSLKGNADYNLFITNIKKLTKGMNQKETVKIVNNEITKKVSYYNGVVEGNSSSTGDFAQNTAYGALINGEAICQGYANLFMLTMDDLNIPSIKIRGYNKSNGEYHVWNSVFVDGEWLYVDVTWNDVLHNKHLLTSKSFEKKHKTWDEVLELRIKTLKLLIMEPM